MLSDFMNDEALFRQRVMALRDSIDLLRGKWKICILLNLSVHKQMRFKDLLEEVDGISPKVLSKELEELENNLLLTRVVNNTKPVTVSYSLTTHATKVYPVIDALIDFGIIHRAEIVRK